jgi:predicted tellurium resistance membrane protein TerC
MYQPYPASAPVSQEPARLGPPRSVVRAIQLMYVGAAAELVALVVDLIFVGSLRADLKRQYPHYTSLQLSHAQNARVAFLVLAAIVAASLWLWMARANGSGRSWARTVSAVLFSIGILDLVVELATVPTPAALTIDVVIALIGLVVIVLLFRKESGPFYRPPLAPRP